MLGFYIAGTLVKRGIHSSAALSLSYLLLLLFNPYFLWQAGFQLSFAVSASLILSSSILKKAGKSRLAGLAMASFIAELSSLPFLLYHFQQISLVSFPMNMVMVPFYTLFVIPVSVIGFLLLLLSRQMGECLFDMFDLVMKPVHDFITYAASVDLFTMIVSKPDFLSLLLLAVSVLRFCGFGKGRFLKLRKSALFSARFWLI